MRARLLKEYRGIRWELLLGAVFCGVTAFNQSQVSLLWCTMFSLYFVVRLFGDDYHLQTMDMLFVQPISRRRIWYEKMAVLAGSIGILLLSMVLGALTYLWVDSTGSPMVLTHFNEFLASELYKEQSWVLILQLFCVMNLVVFGSLFFTTWLKNMVASFSFTIISTFVLCAGFTYLAHDNLHWLPHESDILVAPEAMLFTLFPVAIYGGITYLAACFLYRRFESNGITQKSLDLVSLFLRAGTVSRPVVQTAKLLTLNRLSMSGQLFLKELALHQVSWLLFGVCLVAYFLGALLFNPENPEANVGKALFWGSLFISGIILPLTVGAVAVAEERNLGLWECQLVQPASRLYQWIIKIATTYIIVCAVAIGFPRLGIWLGSHIFNLPFVDQQYDYYQKITPIISGIVGLGVTTLAIFASSLCRTPIRALLTSITFFAVAYATIPVTMDYFFAFLFELSGDIASYYLEWLFPNTYLVFLQEIRNMVHTVGTNYLFIFLFSILLILAGVVLGIAFTNYRRQQIPLKWKAVQSMIVVASIQFFILITAFHAAILMQ